MASLKLIACCGREILPYLDAAARLRMTVFREFPYLYEGSLGNEKEYLASYAQCDQAFFALLIDADQAVGISTGLPMIDADPAFQDPFHSFSRPKEEIFYLGESCLLPSYRGKGWGHAFFDAREAYAQELGATMTTFCSVVRSETHPHRPPQARQHDKFWRKRGYQPTTMKAELTWPQIDSPEPVRNQLVFWTRDAAQNAARGS